MKEISVGGQEREASKITPLIHHTRIAIIQIISKSKINKSFNRKRKWYVYS